MPRILLAEDHEIVRAGIRELLRARPDFEICGEAVGTKEAVSLVAATAPDVVVMGQLAANGVLDPLPLIISAALPGAVLLVAREGSPPMAQRAFTLGALGYLLASDTKEELLLAVGLVAGHGRYVSPQIPIQSTEPQVNGARLRTGVPPSLTLREGEVLALVVSGHRTGEIANILDISRKTVETHRGAIMRKLHLHRLADVVRYAVQNNLCSPALSPGRASS